MAGYWETLAGYGESAWESVSENFGKLTDSYVDAQMQEWANKQANPQVQKEAEPVKGSTVEGQPIVVTPPGLNISNSQVAMLAGGALLLLVVAIAARG